MGQVQQLQREPRVGVELIRGVTGDVLDSRTDVVHAYLRPQLDPVDDVRGVLGQEAEALLACAQGGHPVAQRLRQADVLDGELRLAGERLADGALRRGELFRAVERDRADDAAVAADRVGERMVQPDERPRDLEHVRRRHALGQLLELAPHRLAVSVHAPHNWVRVDWESHRGGVEVG